MNKFIICFFAFILSSTIFAKENLNSHELKNTVLAAHNQFRIKHHAPSLQWDETLADYAEKYAAKCEFKHSGSAYGENLAIGYPSASVAVKSWYHEMSAYSYARPGFTNKTGHFTQLVWRSTTKIGCGYVACNGKNGIRGNYLVCEYSPRGNVNTADYFRANVLRAEN